MSVINITITNSTDQVVSGIPKTVSISTNIPATIFYTLDGTAPTLFSNNYTSPIFIPYDKLSVTLNVMATNGVDFSPIITETYQTDIVDSNARLPHAPTTGQPMCGNGPYTYPFGSQPFEPDQKFLNPADAGVTVYNPSLPATPTAYTADGYPTGFTNQPFNTLNYQIPYSFTDAEGQTGPGIGTLPARAYYNPNLDAAYDGEQTEQFTTTFNPRALVIFQDFTKQDPSDPPQINRANFTLENLEKARDGTYFYNSGPDGAPPPSGSFIKAYYNPRDGTITHYYRDSWSNQWIISKSPYTPNGPFDGNMSKMPVAWGGKVFEWPNPAVGRMRTLF